MVDVIIEAGYFIRGVELLLQVKLGLVGTCSTHTRTHTPAYQALTRTETSRCVFVCGVCCIHSLCVEERERDREYVSRDSDRHRACVKTYTPTTHTHVRTHTHTVKQAPSAAEFAQLSSLLQQKCDENDDLNHNLRLAKDSLRCAGMRKERERAHECVYLYRPCVCAWVCVCKIR